MSPISNASRLADFGSGIGTAGAVLQVDNLNNRVGIGTTNPQGMLQVGQGVTVYGSTGIVSATSYYGDGSNLDGLVSAAVTQYIAADSITSSGIVTITNTTDATSTSTGALIISGGVGIAKSLHVGQNITIGGTLTYEDVTNVDSIGVVTARSGVNVSGGQFLVGSGVTIGNAGVATFSGTSDIHLTDGVRLKFGDGNDLQIHHSSTNSFIQDAGTGNLYIDSNQLYVRNYDTSNLLLFTTSDGEVRINHNGNTKLGTTNDGVSITGIATFSQGCDFNGLLREKFNQVDAKLSAGTNIDLEDGMLHYYSVNETTTATPNIRYNSSYSLNNKMTIGEAVTITIIYKPNNAGYYASLNVDGSGVTEEWNGGEAPSSANSSGYDILTHTLIKTADANFLCFSNLQNYA